MKKLAASVALAIVLASPAWAAVETVTLSVPGMTCPACPVTVKTALSRVQGVSHVEVRYRQREAIVTYDGAKATVRQLTEATANAGYPSKVSRP